MRARSVIKSLAGITLLFCLLPAWGHAQKQAPQADLPLRASLVLSKINPLLQKKQYQRAIEILSEFQARGGPAPAPGKPDGRWYHHPEIYFALGNCYLMREEYEQALNAYHQTVAGDPAHTFGWLNLGKACYEMKLYAEAGHGFSQGYHTARQKNPAHLYHSAAAYLMAEQPDRAVEIFQRLSAAHPAAVKPEWKEHYIHALLAANQPRRALPVIRELVRLYSGEKKIQWQENLLYQYLQLDMQTDALKLVRKLTRETPAEPRWWKALAHIQLNADQSEKALAALTIYSFLTPLSAEEKKLMADLSLQLGIPVKAVPLYEACLQTKPDRQMLQRLVHAYRQLGQPETALARLDALKPNPQTGEIVMLKGELLYTLERYDEAAHVFRRAAQSKGRHVGRAWLMAGYAAWQMNDFSTGKEAFVKAGQYSSQKKAATAALEQIAQSRVR
jgi:tetratricopeptide (TPR) repeat protein